MLEVRNLSVAYAKHRALENISIRMKPGELVVMIGANGAGKSTLLRAICGICEGQCSGDVEMNGSPILGLGSDKIVESGIALVPEGRGIFGDLTVIENLKLGAYSSRARDDDKNSLDRVFNLFPKLEERRTQLVNTMSGGEQQMVAIGRAMMSNPEILMLDEPSLGLSPLLCKELFSNLAEVAKTGIGILLVEQNARQSLAIADRGYLLENAHIIQENTAMKLLNDPAVQEAYLGGVASDHSKTNTGTITAGDNSELPIRTSQEPVSISAAAFVSPGREQHRKTASELLGYSVDELVLGASAQSSSTSRSKTQLVPDFSTSRTGSTVSQNNHLQTVLQEIEQAAEKARRRTKSRSNRSDQ